MWAHSELFFMSNMNFHCWPWKQGKAEYVPGFLFSNSWLIVSFICMSPEPDCPAQNHIQMEKTAGAFCRCWCSLPLKQTAVSLRNPSSFKMYICLNEVLYS